MRKYLVDFFSEFEYGKSDADYLLFTYDRIMAREDTARVWDEALKIYERDINCDYSLIISLAQDVAARLDMHTYTAELLVFICMTKRLRELYIERGISLSIFKNTILDLKYKLDECKTVKGIVGTFVAFWFDRFYNLERFGLGRLEFEVDRFGRHYERDGKVLTPDSRVINVHIPRTLTHLTPESCDEAFKKASEFFRDEVDESCPFVCHSWMLYPDNLNILPKDSNVYNFCSRFDIIESSKNPSGDDLWRIFDTDEMDFDRLPRDTRMRRAIVDYLKENGSIGQGYGVFFLK